MPLTENVDALTAIDKNVELSGIRIWLQGLKYLLGVLILINPFAIEGQSQANYAIHANIIYRFTKYIDWPDKKKSGDFIIGIIGDTPLFDLLDGFVENKMAGRQKIIVKKLSSSANDFNCQILFIGGDASGSLKRIVSRTEGKSILIVSESEGLAGKGSCINFVIVRDHLKLEINKNNIEQRHLSIANELLSLGIVVQ